MTQPATAYVKKLACFLLTCFLLATVKLPQLFQISAFYFPNPWQKKSNKIKLNKNWKWRFESLDSSLLNCGIRCLHQMLRTICLDAISTALSEPGVHGRNSRITLSCNHCTSAGMRSQWITVFWCVNGVGGIKIRNTFFKLCTNGDYKKGMKAKFNLIVQCTLLVVCGWQYSHFVKADIFIWDKWII